MKDERALEEKLMGELDRMYRHVADLESSQEAVEQDDNPYGHEQPLDPLASTHAKIIPFPGHRIHLPSREPSEEEPRQKRKSSYRPYLIIIASFFVVFLAFILNIIPLKGIITHRGSAKEDPHQSTFPIHLTPSPPVQKEEVLQNIEERQEKAETIPHQTINPISPFTQERYYAIQVGAFRKRENASELIEALQRKDLEAYWIEMVSKSRRTIYIVFSGYFADRNEAARFMKEKNFLKNYPDSFVREVSF